MRFRAAKRVSWAICLIVSQSIALVPLLGHDLEDGFVERAVQVRVRDGKLHVEYTIGLTEPTMQQIVDSANSKKSAPSMDHATSDASSDVRENFKSVARFLLSQDITLEIDGVAHDLVFDSVSDYPKHNYDFVFNLSCKLSASKQSELVCVDRSFNKMDGAVRYALKSNGNSIISRTNVAPIIVRSKRHDLGTLKPDERHNACQIKATNCHRSTGNERLINAPAETLLEGRSHADIHWWTLDLVIGEGWRCYIRTPSIKPT